MAGYAGSNCEIAFCFGKNSTDPTVCSGQGNCTIVEFCQCKPQFFGANCQFPSCFGVRSDNISVCSGFGVCNSSDVCVCSNHYEGENCQKRKVIYDLYLNLCKNNSKCTWGIAESCLQVGHTCYCDTNNNEGTIVCNGSDITHMDISGNYIVYQSISETLPVSIQAVILDYTSTAPDQSPGKFDFDSSIYNQLKNLSLAGNNFCGPFPPSWLTPGLNLNLKNHTKTLWCDESINADACSLLELTNSFTVIHSGITSVNITFNSTCDTDYSALKCASSAFPEGSFSLSSSNKQIICPTTQLLNSRDQLYLVRFNKPISRNSSVYKFITHQPLNQINGTAVAYEGQKLVVPFSMHYGIPVEIHDHMECKIQQYGYSSGKLSSVNGLDNLLVCTFTGNQTTSPAPNNTNINFVGGSLGYVNETRAIRVTNPLGIALLNRAVLSDIQISIDGDLKEPKPAEIGSTTTNFISFPTFKFYKSVYKNSQYYVELTVEPKGIRPYPVDKWDDDINNAPYVQYRVNFSTAGNYYIFNNAEASPIPSTFFIGLNINERIRILRGPSSGFSPPANEKANAPQLSVPSAGVHDIYIWRGNSTIGIRSIVFFLVSEGQFNLDDTHTISSDYDDFVTSYRPSVPGYFRIHLEWNYQLRISNTIYFVAVESGEITGFHPYGCLRNQQFELSIFTNISKMEYNGTINFHCELNGFRYIAVQTGTTFRCYATVTTAAIQFVSVKIVAVHSITMDPLQVTDTITIMVFGMITLLLILLDTLPAISMDPFANNHTQTSQEITFSFQLSLPTDFSRVYCRHVTRSHGVLYSKAQRISGVFAKCKITVPSLTKESADDSVVGLWVNASTSYGDSSFYISSNLSHLVIKTPIFTTIKPVEIIEPNSWYNFTLNISNVETNYNETMYGSTKYGQGDLPGCVVNSPCSIILNDHDFPIRGRILLSISNGFNSIAFASEYFTFVAKIAHTSNSPFPFVLNPQEPTHLISLNASVPYWSRDYQFYCLDSRNSSKSPAQFIGETNRLSCVVESRFKDENFSISVYLNSTDPMLNNLLVTGPREISFDDLKLIPPYVEIYKARTFQILSNSSHASNGSVNFIVPLNYRSDSYSLIDGQNYILPCGPTITDTHCSDALAVQPLPFDIYLSFMKFRRGQDTVMNISKPTLNYKTNSIDIFPHATLINKNITVTINFLNSTLSLGPGLTNVDYFCNVMENGNTKYQSIMHDFHKIKCQIPYLGYNQITISAYIRAPDISSDYILVSKNSMILYYIEPKLLFINETFNRFYSTNEVTEDIEFSTSTIIHASLVTKIRSRLNTTQQYTLQTFYNFGSNITYKARFQGVPPGRFGAYFVYVEDTEQFSISTNQHDLVFVTKSTMTGFNPPVSVANTSSSIRISSNFLSLDYGNAQYFTKFGFPQAIYHNQTHNTTFIVNGNTLDFSTTFFIPDPTTYEISIWMKVFGRELEILPPVSYKFVDSNFFTPNHGLVSGNEVVRILQPKTANKLISVSQPFNSVLFNCSFNSSQLVCATPHFNSTYKPFNSYFLYFQETQELLSAKFILYETRKIMFLHPTILPYSNTFPKFSLNVTFDNVTNMVEGNLVAEISSQLKTTIANFGPMNNIYAYQTNVNSNDLEAGIFSVQFYYENVNSLAFRQQIPFTDEKNVTFVDVDATIAYADCNRITHVNETLSIEIARSSEFLPSLLPFVKCKLGNETVPTVMINSTNFKCNVSSNVAGVHYLSLWYIHSDAQNGEMRISPNQLAIVVVQKIRINRIDPFTGMRAVSHVPFLYTNFLQNIYTFNAAVFCEYDGKRAEATHSADGRFFCLLYEPNDAKNVSVSLSIKSSGLVCQNHIPFSENSVQFIFRKPTVIDSISPFAQGFSTNSQNFSFDVSLKLKDGETIVNDEGVFCKYNGTNEIVVKSKARLEGNIIKCEVSKSSFNSDVEYIQVGLSLNTTAFIADSAYFSNIMKVVFYKVPLRLKDISVIDEKLNGGFHMDIPTYESHLIYTMNMTEDLNVNRITNVECLKGVALACKPALNSLNPIHQPSIYNLTLIIANEKLPGVYVSLDMDPIIFYKNNNSLISAVPYFASYLSHKINPLKLKLSTSTLFNHQKFSFYCKSLQNAGEMLSIARIEYSSSANSSFTCDIKSTIAETFLLNIGFIVNSTYYPLTTEATFKFVEPITIDNSLGFYTGKTKFQYQTIVGFPTIFKNDYSITLKYQDYNVEKIVNCTVGVLPNIRVCESPQISSNKFPRNLQLAIFIDDVKAMSLIPMFQYIDVPSIDRILPYHLVDVFSQQKTIKLQSSSFSHSKNQKYKIRYEEMNNVQECVVEDSQTISCPVPQHTSNLNSEVTLKLSVDQLNYETLNKKIYLFTSNLGSAGAISIVGNSISPTVISNHLRTNVSFSIINPAGVKFNSTFVRFKDQIIEQVTMGTVENGKIICEVPHFATYNIFYPRNIDVDISFDSIEFFGIAQTLQLNGFETVDFSPKTFLGGENLRLSFMNFPSLNLNGKPLRVQLKSNDSTVVKLNCNSNLSNCSSNFNASLSTHQYTIEIIDDSETPYFIPLTSNFISVIPTPTLKLNNFKISRLMSNQMYLTGSGFEKVKNAIKIRGFFDGKFVDATVQVLNDKIGFMFGPIKRSLKRSFSNSLQISFNDGHDYTTISNQIELIDDFTFDALSTVPENILDSIISFQNTTLKLSGTNLNNTAIIKLQNELFTYTTTVVDSDPKFITVVIPQFSYYSPKSSFSFPVIATIGISLNDGVDFKTRTVTIVDRFAVFFLVGIEPAIGDRSSRNITVRGSNLEDVKFCEFRDSNRVLLSKVSVLQLANDLICPFEYRSQYDSLNRISINLLNSFNDTSDSVVYSLIENPQPQTIVPSQGEAVGNYSVIITGLFDTRINEIYYKIGTLKVPDPCIVLNSTAVKCRVVSNANGPAKIELSYNRIEWYATSSNFTFLPCKPGFGTSSYQEPCRPCPLGQFKANEGIEVCTNCPANTYADKIGSTNCTACPNKMKTTKSATIFTSISQCVCINNTMVHPKTGICIDCPIGGICTPENVTLPKSAIGWWFSSDDITLFFQCYPIERCFPDTPDNCTIGYDGQRCGKCQDGYYKSKLVCKKCNDAYITALTFVGFIVIVLLILAIAGFFLFVTSTQISQLTSLSIAVSYWQIISTFTTLDLNWPAAVDGTLSVASATNFNVTKFFHFNNFSQFDFLAPECIFRVFQLKYDYFYVYFTNISMPFVFIFAFLFLYFLLVCRSLFAATIGFRIAKCLKLKFKRPLDDNEDEDETNQKKWKIISYCKSTARMVINNFIWLRNMIVWSIREKSSSIELRRLFSKTLGACLSFIVFFYLRIMTTSFQVFGCDIQPNGTYTLKESPDILCYQGWWLVFVPTSLISITLFGVGGALYFVILIINFKRWEKLESFFLINRFTLRKYKKKYFYWQFFDSFRKLAFSLLTVFFKPMFLITVGIAVIFSGMMLNVHFIPYRKKFHNVMHYFVLMSTLMTLFAGLLLFVVDNNETSTAVIDPGLKEVLSYLLPIITVVLIIGSNVVVVGMFLFDIYIRRKKEKKRVKKKKRMKQAELMEEEKLSNVIDNLHGKNMETKSSVPWETEHDFQFVVNLNQKSDVEDDSKSMNEILSNLFSLTRAKKKGYLIRRAGQRATSKILKSSLSKKASNMNQENFEKKVYVMPNGYVMSSDFDGDVKFIASSNQGQTVNIDRAE